MAVSPGLRLVLVLLLSCGHLNSSAHKSCPEFCTCQPSLQLNCSSTGLFVAPTNIDTSISELDLSNNQLGSLTFQLKYRNLHKLWLGNNSMPHLSLCVDLGLKGQSTSRLSRSCVLWAPTLQLLSVHRNQLQKLPQGLGQQRSLQVLLLSFNNISTLEQNDFFHLEQLEELNLQHNLIRSLHPQIFEKLYRLKHLDLSFNLLTTIHPVTYMTLQHIGADVAVRGNRWICDCRMSFLQRQRVYENSRSQKMWFIECASPLSLSGKNLQELDKEHLDCQDSNIHQEVSVHKGSTTRLPCSKADAVWWTPIGQATKEQQQGSLLIRNITKPSEGLYVCLSTSLQILSSYYVHIHDQNYVHINDQNRRIRSVSDKHIHLHQNKMANNATGVSQSHFAMAVSLSVIITFIIAFILGVFLQPYICACWQKNKTRKNKPQINSVPNVHQQQYVNDAYLHCEDVDDIESHRERRVTFSEYPEEGNMQYYEAGNVQESNGAVIGPGQAKVAKKIEFEIIPNSAERNSISSQSSKSTISDNILKENCSTPNTTQVIKEHIQKATPGVQINTTERSNEIPGFVSEPFADWSPHENITIAHSDLDNGEPFEYSDSVRSGSPISPNSSFKQSNINVQNINKDSSFKSSSSSSVMSDSEPTHYTVNTDSEDEVFEKTVSIQSSSNSDRNLTVETWPVVDLEYIPAIKRRLIFKIAHVDSYSTDIAKECELQLKQTYPIIEQNSSTIKKRKAPLPPRKTSSSSSENGMDTGEFKEEKVQVETKPDLKVVQLEQQSPWPVVNLECVGKVKRSLDFKVQNTALTSLPSIDSEDDRIYEEIIEQMPMGSKHVSGASSSSESEEEQEFKEVKQYQENTLQLTSPNMKLEEKCQLPVINLAKIPKVKQRLELTHVREKLPSIISFSSEDEHETSEERDNYYENIQRVSSQKKQESQWPGIDLVQIPKVKRRLDVKTAKPAVQSASRESDSSFSSDSEDDQQIKVIINQENLQKSTSPINPPKAIGQIQESQWPMVNLVRIPKVKRRLDVKTAKPAVQSASRESDSSFSSDSEDDQQIKVIANQENLQKLTSPINPPKAIGPIQESQWPMVNLVRIPKVKRRLDLKTAKPAVQSASSDSETEHIYENVQGMLPTGVDNVLRQSDSSFSSESEDDQQINQTINQANLQQSTSPINPPKVIGPNQESQWPMINLIRIPKVKRRLDLKTAKPAVRSASSSDGKRPAGVDYVLRDSDSSFSSESEDDQKIKVIKQENVLPTTTPINQPKELRPNQESQWPMVNLVRIPKVKRRLDLKTAKPAVQSASRESDSSFSSDSEDDQQIKVIINQENLQKSTSPINPPKAIGQIQESQWPMVNLVRIPKVKRRLDLKTAKPAVQSASRESDSSFSSDSEDDQQIKVIINQENLQKSTSPINPPKAIGQIQESQWPMVNLVRIPKVKRRLDVKTAKPAVQSASRESDSSFSSDSEDDQQIKVIANQENLQKLTSPINPPKAIGPIQESQWPMVNLVRIPKVKRRLDLKTAKPAVQSASSDSETEHIYENVQGMLPTGVDNVLRQSDSSFSSESEDDQQINQTINQANLQQSTSPINPPKVIGPNQESQWPMINLIRIPKVKRRLDLKTAKPAVQSASSSDGKRPTGDYMLRDSDSSLSSESEDDKIKVTKNQETIQLATTPINLPKEIRPNPESQWPMINLVSIPKVKRRLEIRGRVDVVSKSKLQEIALIPKSDLGTSSSESEDEQEIKEEHYQEKLHIITSPNSQSTRSQWPVINLAKIPSIKRRLDIKERESKPSAIVNVSKPEVRYTSSSESEDEVHKEKLQETTSVVIPSTAIKPNQELQWPEVNLVKVSKVKRRLDIKTVEKLQFETYSSTETEDEQEKLTKENLQQIVPPSKQPSETKWPVINLKIPKIRRRLDIKEKVVPDPQMVTSTSIKIQKQASETSSSNESEDEPEIKGHENVYENIQQVTNKEPTLTLESESQWPAINLFRVPKLKRRLDIKPKSNLYSTSSNVTTQFDHSSSSESEDEKEIKESKRDNTVETSQNLHQSEWPSLDLFKIPKVDRRLDFKRRVNTMVTEGQERLPSASNIIPKQDSGASSSSESDHELPTIDSQWPMIDLVKLPKLKRRLDVKDRIKLALGASKLPLTRVHVQQPKSSSSSYSEEEQIIHVNQDNLQQLMTSTNKQQAQSQWPVIDLVNASKVKRRLHFKTTIPNLKSSEDVAWVQDRVPSTKVSIPKNRLGTSSSSESEDETIQKLGSQIEPQTQWPVMDLGSITRIKKRLDFKIKSQSLPLPVSSDGGSSKILVSSSSSIAYKSPQISAAQRLPSQIGTGIPYISRRLDIKGPAIATSSSDDEKDMPKPSGSVTSQDKNFIKVSPISTLPRSPTKTAQSIELEKYTVVTDKFRDNTSGGSSSQVVTPELQLKWAGMNLGVSRFRRRLDVTKPGDLPPSPPSSPNPDTFFPAIGTERVPIIPTREQNEGRFTSSESEDVSNWGKSSKREVVSVPPQVGLTSIPYVKRSLIITAKQKSLTSSSSSDEDTVAVPDLSRGIPRIKRRLHIKAPTPPPSSTSSDEKVYAHTFSDVTDQRSIEYKRTIMKSTSYDSFSSQRDFYREPLYVESNRHTPKKLSLDNIKRKLMPSKQNELPPNLRWTSVGTHLSEHPIPTVRRQQEGYTSPTTGSLPQPIIKANVSDNSSRSEDEQNEVKTSSIITQKTYSPRSVTFNTSPIILKAAPEDRVEPKGLSAIKAMSSDRRNWESEIETFTESVPVSVDPPEVQNVYGRKVNIHTKISHPQTFITASPGLEEMRRAEMLYGIPSNKRHTIKSTEVPQGPPPPVPSTPLPDESPNFAWKSPQSSLSRGSLSYVQRKTTEEESVDEPFFDNPNISSV